MYILNLAIYLYIYKSVKPSYTFSKIKLTTYFIVIILSPCPLLCFSTSMCAPVAPRIALILLPPLPITLLMAFNGTDTFFDRKGEFKYLQL